MQERPVLQLPPRYPPYQPPGYVEPPPYLPMPPQPVMYQPVPKQPKRLANASLILGIISVLSSWLILTLPIPIVGLVMAIVSLRRNGKGKAIAGLVLSTIAIVITIVEVVFLYIPYLVGTADLQAHLPEYTNISAVQGNLENPYIVGKVIVIDVNQHSIATLQNNYSLHDISATNSQEVRTIIWLDCKEQVAGSYQSGATAFQTNCTLTIIDKSAKTIVGVKTFTGEEPPTVNPKWGVDWHGSAPSDDAMMNYLLSLPRR